MELVETPYDPKFFQREGCSSSALAREASTMYSLRGKSRQQG